jgi:hypothetical protein
MIESVNVIKMIEVECSMNQTKALLERRSLRSNKYQ